MTNFDMLMNCQTPEQFLRQWKDALHCGCRQKTKEDWKTYCLSDNYRGQEGCKRCTIDFLNSEYYGGINGIL